MNKPDNCRAISDSRTGALCSGGRVTSNERPTPTATHSAAIINSNVRQKIDILPPDFIDA
jgi:hypothetical protein